MQKCHLQEDRTITTESSRVVIDLEYKVIFEEMHKLEEALSSYRSLEFDSGVKMAAGFTAVIIDKMLQTYSRKHHGRPLSSQEIAFKHSNRLITKLPNFYLNYRENSIFLEDN